MGAKKRISRVMAFKPPLIIPKREMPAVSGIENVTYTLFLIVKKLHAANVGFMICLPFYPCDTHSFFLTATIWWFCGY